MRLLQLNPTGVEAEALDLHPMVTVVTGLSPQGREAIERSVRALPAGGDPGCPGLLESHGIFLDLSHEMLGLLGLDTDADVVLRAEDLRQVGVAAPEIARSALEVEGSAISAEQYLELTAKGVDAELDAARKAQAGAREALAILRGAAEQARAEFEEVAGRRRRAQAALDAARSAGSRSAVQQEAIDDGLRDERAARLATELSELEDELERVNRGIAELRGLDTRPIQVLLDAIKNPEPVELIPSERAIELADDMERLQARIDAMEDELEAAGKGPRSAMAALETAREALNDAEHAMAKPELSADDVAELEAAHDAVLEAEQKASGGLGRKAAQKRLDEAIAHEQEVLDRVGFPTWSSYVMGADMLGTDPLAQERVERARFDLEAAEATWAQVSAGMLSDPEHVALIELMEAHYMEAIDLLGGEPEGDLATELRELKVAKREVTVDELVDALSYQLELVGISLGNSAVLDRTVMVADAFLEEASGVHARIEELEATRTELEGRCALVEQAERDLRAGIVHRDDAPAPAADDSLASGDELDLGEFEDTVAEAAEAEQEAGEFLEARDALLDAAIQIESVATGKLKKLAADHASEESERRAADPLAAFDTTRLGASTEISFVDTSDVDAGKEALEFFLLSRLARLRSLSFAGSVPLLLDDALCEVSAEVRHDVLAKLERTADSVQVIYMTDAADVVAWAEEVGFQRAAVVSAPPAFA